MNKDYQRCIDHLLYIHGNAPTVLELNYLLLLDSLEKTGQNGLERKTISEIDRPSLLDERTRIITVVYEEKCSPEPDLHYIETMIVTHLRESQFTSDIYNKILKDMLMELVEKTGDHEMLFRYFSC